jgi:dihydrofolate reductase
LRQARLLFGREENGMARVLTRFTISLDGYIAGPEDDVQALFPWYFTGEVEIPIPGQNRVFKTSPASAVTVREMFENCGAIVTGRRDFEVSKAWGGKPPFDVPAYIVTHSLPQEWARNGSPFTFVTQGVESAITQACQAAGEKQVYVGGTQIVRQALEAGLIDIIEIDLFPILLGSGIRLFEQLPNPVNLEIERVIDAPLVTHIRYRVAA